MTTETVTSEHGSREHIVVDKGGEHGIVVACGHTHFEGPTEEYSSISDIDNLCKNCQMAVIDETDTIPKESLLECPMCGDEIIEDELVIQISTFRIENLERGVKTQVYHAGCFMNIVNVDTNVIARTDIETGNVELYRDEDGNMRIRSPKAEDDMAKLE